MGDAPVRRFVLGDFRGDGYDRGRSVAWQLGWLVVSNLVWRKWWLPRRARPAILRLFGARVGSGCVIREGVRVHWPWKLTLGDNVWLGEASWLLNLEPITIGSNTCVSQEALICTGSHQFMDPTFEFDNAPIELGERCWVAARAIVLRGTRLPDDTLVSAGTVFGRRA